MNICLSCPSRNLNNTCKRAIMLGVHVKDADCDHFICLKKQSGSLRVKEKSSGL